MVCLRLKVNIIIIIVIIIIKSYPGLYLTGVRWVWPPARGSWPPGKFCRTSLGVDSNPLRAPLDSIFLLNQCLPLLLTTEKWVCLHKLTVYVMQITDNAVSQWVMLDCFLAWHSAYSTDSATEILNTSEIYLRIEVQYLGNAAWYGVGVNRWPIGNHPSFMFYRLARSPLTQRDWKVKDRFGLVRSANSAQAQSLSLIHISEPTRPY